MVTRHHPLTTNKTSSRININFPYYTFEIPRRPLGLFTPRFSLSST
uniref:Uncharacterized protein n=1 Tax=Nelumbo nucifera TaxID=4432 RepID=A0A822Z0Z6_NELNU|nr:TPA_asm: hypothetical protein HUJ06_007982 [Nelumbo nucifera]